MAIPFVPLRETPPSSRETEELRAKRPTNVTNTSFKTAGTDRNLIVTDFSASVRRISGIFSVAIAVIGVFFILFRTRHLI
jgi:hypothetical protein